MNPGVWIVALCFGGWLLTAYTACKAWGKRR